MVELNHPHTFLKGLKYFFGGENTTYFSWEVLKQLEIFKPKLIVSCGFTPTMLLSFLYAYFKNIKHFIFVDSTLQTDASLSKLQIFIRKAIIKRSNGFISPSKMTDDLFPQYGAAKENIYRSCLAIDNELFANEIKLSKRPYEVGFCSQVVERKNPVFLAKVLAEIATKRKIRLRICGTGPLLNNFLKSLEQANIDFQYEGHLDEKQITEFYSSIKILALPTSYDCWGLVINEAMASGAIVLTSPWTGAAQELVIDKKTGYVEELDIESWRNRIEDILDNQNQLDSLLINAKKQVAKYNHNSAYKGLADAIKSVKVS